jgi:hypothetical protein
MQKAISERISSVITQKRSPSVNTSPHHRFVIALHSPGGVAETGLRVCPPEKNARKLARDVRRAIFSGAAKGEGLKIARLMISRGREPGASPSY